MHLPQGSQKSSKIIKTEDELVNLLKNKALGSFHDETLKSSSTAGENERRENERRENERRENERRENERKENERRENERRENERERRGNKVENDEVEAYFYRMDLDSIHFLLSLGIPEYIIPAVTCHAVAYMLSDLLKLPPDPGKDENTKEVLEKSQKENSPVTELFIRPEDKRLMSFFEKLAASFPYNVIAGRYPEYGMLFLSYAREGEICPDGCPGPRDRCPAFGRKKPELLLNIQENFSGSCQAGFLKVIR